MLTLGLQGDRSQDAHRSCSQPKASVGRGDPLLWCVTPRSAGRGPPSLRPLAGGLSVSSPSLFRGAMECGCRSLEWAMWGRGQGGSHEAFLWECAVWQPQAVTSTQLCSLQARRSVQSTHSRRGIWSCLWKSVSKHVWTHFKSLHVTIVITKNMKWLAFFLIILENLHISTDNEQMNTNGQPWILSHLTRMKNQKGFSMAVAECLISYDHRSED